jgi:hypothetical protein
MRREPGDLAGFYATGKGFGVRKRPVLRYLKNTMCGKDPSAVERNAWELAADRRLLSEVGSRLEASARLAGDWLACRLGCTECCIDSPPCRLCFLSASPEEIERCRVEPDAAGLEDAILVRLEADFGDRGETVVAYALASEQERP